MTVTPETIKLGQVQGEVHECSQLYDPLMSFKVSGYMCYLGCIWILKKSISCRSQIRRIFVSHRIYVIRLPSSEIRIVFFSCLDYPLLFVSPCLFLILGLVPVVTSVVICFVLEGEG